MGSAYDQEWYDLVVNACALSEDFAKHPLYDQFKVGSKGFSLSGGQKQRIVSVTVLMMYFYTNLTRPLHVRYTLDQVSSFWMMF